MNWTEYIDKACGDKPAFTNKEARDLVRRALEYSCDNWVRQRR